MHWKWKSGSILGQYPGLVLELWKAPQHSGWDFQQTSIKIQQLGEQLASTVQRAGDEGHLQRDAGQGDVGTRDGIKQTSRPH